ncbi:serine hydrolase domain-containing protein [Teredinibacter sp. KSP-S5-2]|uniref:serine hydrolase domain-containing protein n=1 Tax=Teredinibacter sp. KSP-S5-2 TaxID=3034506 RepID=UPI0029343178|nr:serine hydrolase domain-containing protein [Teredinibacter sp. KSP-S5-2]WNO08431.1 serine hydrolase [Teredinibacter sp. KSP-S5-2]
MPEKIAFQHISSRQTTNPKWFSPEKQLAASCNPPNLSLINHLTMQMERFISAYQVPDLSIALVDNASTIWTKSFQHGGNRRKAYADNEQARYSVNTLSHVLTAIAIMQQMEQGNLSIDKPYSALFPYMPGATFTLRDLLSYPSKLDQLYLKNQNTPLPRSKGSSVESYSHALTCAALEQASRQSIVDYMNRQLLPQLNMRQSSFHVRAFSDKPNNKSDNSAFSSRLQTTIDDLSQIIKMVNRRGASSAERVLHPDTINTMINPQTPTQELSHYGLGWHIFEETQNSKLVGHLELSAFSSSSVMLLDMHTQVGIALLTNNQQCQLPLYTIAKKALTHMINIKRHDSGSI